MKTTTRRCLAAMAFATALLFANAARAEDFDSNPAGNPTRENLPNGGYKEIYKNEKGERVKEEEFDGSGIQKSTKTIQGYHPNGQEKHTTVEEDGVDKKGNPITKKKTETTYNKDGLPTERIVEENDSNGNPKTRSVTKWPPGSGKDGVTEKFEWDQPLVTVVGKWVPEGKKTKFKKSKGPPPGSDDQPKKKEDEDRPRRSDDSSYFRAGEVQLRAFAVLAVGNAQETDSRTVHETRMVVRDRKVQKTVLEDIPGQPGLTPVTKEIVEPTEVRETVSHREETTVGPYDGHAFGFGMDAKYFVCRHVGLGVEGDWLSAEHDAWSVFATVTARFPLEGRCHVAPYAAAGIGGQFADDSRLVGMIAAGVEKRFSPVCGTFIEGRYLFDGNKENVFELRVGVSMAFGHSDETAGENISVPHRGGGGARSVSWGQIDPLAKELRP